MNNNYDPNQHVQYEQPVYDQQSQYQQAQKAEKENSALTTAIVSACFTCSIYLSIVGLIMAIVAKSKIKEINLNYPVSSGKVSAATIISNISFGFSIAFSILVTMLVIIYIALFVIYGSLYAGLFYGLFNY